METPNLNEDRKVGAKKLDEIPQLDWTSEDAQALKAFNEWIPTHTPRDCGVDELMKAVAVRREQKAS